jgi:hypothetical protein
LTQALRPALCRPLLRLGEAQRRRRRPGAVVARVVMSAVPPPGFEQLVEREDVNARNVELWVIDRNSELLIEIVGCRSFGQERTDPTLLAQK